MEKVVKTFEQLNTMELYEIYKLRSEVFVVEQNCIYQDIDETDLASVHLMYYQDQKLIGYLRVIPAGITFDTVSIGRVISQKRRCGIGTELVADGIQVAKDYFKADTITIEAQVYAKKLYENLGFVQVSEPFLEDGIPHIKMIWTDK